MVPLSTQVHIILLVNISTAMIDSSLIRWLIPDGYSDKSFRQCCADAWSVYIMTEKREQGDMLTWNI